MRLHDFSAALTNQDHASAPRHDVYREPLISSLTL